MASEGGGTAGARRAKRVVSITATAPRSVSATAGRPVVSTGAGARTVSGGAAVPVVSVGATARAVSAGAGVRVVAPLEPGWAHARAGGTQNAARRRTIAIRSGRMRRARGMASEPGHGKRSDHDEDRE